MSGVLLASLATGPPAGATTEFVDVPDNHVFADEIRWMADADITRGCNPPANDRFCPDGPVSRGQMAAFLVRLLGYERDGDGSFLDTEGVFHEDVARLAAAGVTKGCNPPANDRYCPHEPVTRAQMAAFLTRAFSLPTSSSTRFVDDDASVFEDDIDRLAHAQITLGCNPPTNARFCPDQHVTRGQMAAFLARAPVVVPARSDIQSFVSDHPSGTKFLLKRGRYVGQEIEPKDRNWILGEPGAVLDGGGAVEYAFRSHASHIVIAGLEVTNYVPKLQHAPIIAKTYQAQEGGIGWVVEGNHIHHNLHAGLFLSDGGVARGNRIHHNGQIGLKVGWAPNGALVEGNDIHHNNYLGLGDGFEDGGTKFALTDGLVVRGNRVHDNRGPGLWTDIDNRDTLYEGNVVERNTRNGIYHEISYSAIIRDNRVVDNGHGHKSWLWGGGIVVAGSRDVQIYGNTLAGNGNGISLIEQDRGSGRYGEYRLRNISVSDNVVAMSEGQTGVVMDNGDDAVLAPGNVEFDDNVYVVTSFGGEWWRFGDADLHFDEWQARGNDPDGAVRSD